MKDRGSLFTAPRILGLIFLYSALCSLVFFSLSKNIFSYQTLRTTAVKAADGDHVCRGAMVSGSLLDVNHSTDASLLGTSLPNSTQKRLRHGWIGPKGYVTYDNKTNLKKQCGSCAIVNSAGRLLRSRAGEAIDTADCVIRMNGAPTEGYGTDVGTRTTFRVVGHRNFPLMMETMQERRHYLDIEATMSDMVVVWHYAVNWKKNGPARWCKAFCVMFHKSSVFLASEDVMHRNENMFYQELNISKSTETFWMSTGWGTMLFALDVCETIDVYGMIYEDFCSEHPNDTTSYHYFDKKRTECSYYSSSERQTRNGHKFLTEKAVFAKWAAMYGIVFHEPSWDGQLKGYDGNTVVDTLFKRTFREHEQMLMANDTKQRL